VYLNYTRIPELRFTYYDIRKSIDDVVLLLNVDKNISERIKITTHYNGNIPKLKFDKDSIKQVLWNLLINSIQSISSEGIIEIFVEIFNGYVQIKIHDSGKGIPQNHLQRIFKQSYTSKSKGSGLGLSIVKRIIDQHQWTINVMSKQNEGTTFTIKAPLSE